LNEYNFKRISFPTDFSVSSEYALKYALSLAEKYKSKLYILHVADASKDASGFYVPHFSIEKLDDEMKDAAQKMLKWFCDKNLEV
jgi:nucleotide-binding universal stress UspA family protein